MLDDVVQIDIFVHLTNFLLESGNHSIDSLGDQEEDLVLIQICIEDDVLELCLRLCNVAVHHAEGSLHVLLMLHLEGHLLALGFAAFTFLHLLPDVVGLDVLLQR